jgi:hypothetical protein
MSHENDLKNTLDALGLEPVAPRQRTAEEMDHFEHSLLVMGKAYSSPEYIVLFRRRHAQEITLEQFNAEMDKLCDEYAKRETQ